MWEVGGLESPAKDGDSVVLGSDIVEGFGAAVVDVNTDIAIP